jgi:heme/copper-type cytochrome/quinol oxidase subunit 1
MKGLTSVLPHLITVILLWLAIIIIVQLVKRGTFKSIDKLQADEEAKEKAEARKKSVQKVASIVSIGASVIAAAIIVLVVFFLYNPTERNYEELDNIKTATIDEKFVEPSKEEIEALNVKSHDVKKSEAKEVEAQEDNIQAMEESIDLFRKIAKEAEDANTSKPGSATGK